MTPKTDSKSEARTDAPQVIEPIAPELESMRRRYSDEALRSIPRLLGLIDRNPYSRTYGSFDRSYWHYRTMDFPCGMSQEFVLPLALVYHHAFPDNPYCGKERMRELALAGIEFARGSAHADGSCDDYFPFERALGAMVFSLYAMTETCLVLGDRRPEFLEFFARRGDWLINHNESGQLANHQAFAALALHNVHRLTGDERFAAGREHYLDIVKSWQHAEGWFQEYEGADPGYHSCSIAFLGKLMKKTEGTPTAERILTMLRPAVDFAWYFMHPDGSYAGEYGSRNTYHFYPHGFEVMAPHEAKAGQIADQFLHLGLPRASRYFNEDDRMCAHYVYDWLQSYLDFHTARPEPLNERADFARYWPGAKMLARKTASYYAVANLAKGGVIKVTTQDGPVYSDTGLIARLADGRVLVSHLMDGDHASRCEVAQSGAESNAAAAAKAAGPIIAESSGCLSERRTNLATPLKQILFRILNLTFGRFAPDLLRRILQRVLITGKTQTPFRFARRFELGERTIEIVDEIIKPEGAGGEFTSLHIGSDATSIYVANSNVYQQSVLLPWQDLGEPMAELNAKGRMTYRHTAFEGAGAPPASEHSSDRGADAGAAGTRAAGTSAPGETP